MTSYGRFIDGAQRPSQPTKERWIIRRTNLLMPQARGEVTDEVVAQICAMYPYRAVAALASHHAEYEDNTFRHIDELILSPRVLQPDANTVQHWMRLGCYDPYADPVYGYVPVTLDEAFVQACTDRALYLLHDRKPSGVALDIHAMLTSDCDEVKLVVEYTAYVPRPEGERSRPS